MICRTVLMSYSIRIKSDEPRLLAIRQALFLSRLKKMILTIRLAQPSKMRTRVASIGIRIKRQGKKSLALSIKELMKATGMNGQTQFHLSSLQSSRSRWLRSSLILLKKISLQSLTSICQLQIRLSKSICLRSLRIPVIRRQFI